MKLSSHHLSNAFTLVEMIAVVAIMLLIAGLALPNVSSLLKGPQLTQAAHAVHGQLQLAHQNALTKNRAVEVRFYQFAEPGNPGEQAGDPSTGKFRALQLFEIEESGTPIAMGKMMRLPASIIIDSGETLSTLIAKAKAAPDVPTAAAGTSAIQIPGAGTNYNYVAFRFQPGGGTNLPSATGTLWFVTLHALNDLDQRTTPPPNFITLQITPTNGHIQILRP